MVAVVVGRETRIDGSQLALVWPAAGVGLLWTSWAWRRGAFLGASLAGVAVLAALGNGLTGTPWPLALVMGLANAIQALVGAAVLARLSPDGRRELDSPRGLAALVAACLAGAAVGTLVAPLAVHLSTGASWGSVAGPWWVRNGVSSFVIAAAALRLAPRTVLADTSIRRHRGETPLLLLALTVVYGAVFGLADDVPVAFMVVPFCLWIGLRYSTTAGVLHTLVAATWITAFTLAGRGPFAELPVAGRGAVAQMMIAVVALTTLVLALQRDQRDALAAEVVAAAERAAEQAGLLEVVVSSISDGIVVVDESGEVIVINPSAREIMAGTGVTGTRIGEWVRSEGLRHLDGTPLAEADLPLVRALQGADVDEVDIAVTGADGDRDQVLSFTARPLRRTGHTSPDAPPAGAVSAFRDVTERRRHATRLERSERHFRTVFDGAPVGMAILDVRSGLVSRANDDLAAFVGVDHASDLVGRALRELVVDADRPSIDDAMTAFAATEVEQVRAELRFGDADHPSWGSVSLALLEPASPADDGSATVVALVEDVTARKRAEAALTHQALHDQLTDLANRALLLERLEEALADDRRGAAAGLMYLDLDGFKAVNDTYGHATGDQLLVVLARRLEGLVRSTDTVARLGGDEFAILCPDLEGEGELDAVAARVHAAVAEPVRLSIGPVTVEASVGVVRLLGAGDAETLLRSADEAMYVAKRGGSNGVVSMSTPEQARASRAVKLLPELARAIAEDQLEMVGQPILSVDDGSVSAVEALVRWRHPRRGLLTPDQFLDVLETSSLMAAAWEQILHLSLAGAASWPATVAPAPRVHVNVSGRQLQEGDLRSTVMQALECHDVDPARLVLELTETFVPLITDSVRADIEDLRRQGISIALDDLGTGYSSMALLTELPVDVLKIDRRFVSGLGSDPRCEAVVHSIVSLGQRLDLEVVAEGIETRAQHDVVVQMGCRSAQGYLYSRPLEQPELRGYLATGSGARWFAPRGALG
ncbi:MAG: EAL domain-containing protein [Nocardioidaceae bacterium]|nr:EAL domain-containing protein [Nocardioidaceae bacterium]